MVKLVILFRAGTNSPEYDEKYNDFLMSLDALPRVRRKAVSSVYGAPNGLMHYRDIIEVYFTSRTDLEAALTSEPGIQAGTLLARFAGPSVVTLFAEVMEEDYPQ